MTTFDLYQSCSCSECGKKDTEIIVLDDIAFCLDCYLKASDGVRCVCKLCGSVSYIFFERYSDINDDFVLFPSPAIVEICEECESL